MKNFIVHTKSLYTHFTSGHVSYVKTGIRPRRDWNVLVSLFFVLFVGLAIFSFYFYTQVESGALFGVIDDTQWSGVSINKDLLNTTVENIQQRQKKLDVVDQSSTSVDPSI